MVIIRAAKNWPHSRLLLRKSLGCGESAPTCACSIIIVTCDANAPTIEMVTVGSPHGIHLRSLSALMWNTRFILGKLAVAQIVIVKVCSPALRVWNKQRNIAVYSMKMEDYGDQQCPSLPSARNSPMRR